MVINKVFQKKKKSCICRDDNYALTNNVDDILLNSPSTVVESERACGHIVRKREVSVKAPNKFHEEFLFQLCNLPTIYIYIYS
jgi:hypothetical protein